jgi:valyl-tRNA synthetase
VDTIKLVEQNFDNQYNFNLIVKKLREFYVNNFCDFYLESTKPVLKTDDYSLSVQDNVWNILRLCNSHTLLMYHPFMPSLTEELWQRLNGLNGESSILDHKYPSYADLSCKEVILRLYLYFDF